MTAAELDDIFTASRGRWELCMAHMTAEEFCRIRDERLN